MGDDIDDWGKEILQERYEEQHTKYINSLIDILDDPDYTDFPVLIGSEFLYVPPFLPPKEVIKIFKQAIKIVKATIKANKGNE